MLADVLLGHNITEMLAQPGPPNPWLDLGRLSGRRGRQNKEETARRKPKEGIRENWRIKRTGERKRKDANGVERDPFRSEPCSQNPKCAADLITLNCTYNLHKILLIFIEII